MEQVTKRPLEIPSHVILLGILTVLSLIRLPPENIGLRDTIYHPQNGCLQLIQTILFSFKDFRLQQLNCSNAYLFFLNMHGNNYKAICII